MRIWKATMTVMGFAGRGALAAFTAAGLSVPGAAQDLPGDDVPLSPEMETVYRVGRMDGQGWETFGEIRSVAFDGSGRLYLLDGQTSRITVLSPEGRHVRTFGKRGDGPGEFRALTGFTVLEDGTVVAQDMGHQAYLVFDPSGEYRRSVPLDARGSGAVTSVSVSAGQLLPDRRGDAVYEAGVRLTFAEGPASHAGGHPIHRIPVSGRGEQTVAHAAWRPEEDSGDRVTQNPDGSTAVRLSAGPRIWEPRVHLAPLPDGGLAVVDSTTWAVDMVGPGGGVRTTLRRPALVPLPVTERVARAERERRIRRLEEEGPGIRMQLGNGRSLAPDQLQAIARSRVESATFYHEVPVIQGLRASPGGVMWVQRANLDDPQEHLVDLVRWNGTYLGTVRGMALPDALGPDGLAAWIERDDLDVPQVVVRRVPEALR